MDLEIVESNKNKLDFYNRCVDDNRLIVIID